MGADQGVALGWGGTGDCRICAVGTQYPDTTAKAVSEEQKGLCDRVRAPEHHRAGRRGGGCSCSVGGTPTPCHSPQSLWPLCVGTAHHPQTGRTARTRHAPCPFCHPSLQFRVPGTALLEYSACTAGGGRGGRTWPWLSPVASPWLDKCKLVSFCRFPGTSQSYQECGGNQGRANLWGLERKKNGGLVDSERER